MIQDLFQALLKSHLVATIALAYATWTITSGIYNWYFHPLSKFPGPKWAAFGVWWKVNLELLQGKNLVEELFKLHDRYGELVFAC